MFIGCWIEKERLVGERLRSVTLQVCPIPRPAACGGGWRVARRGEGGEQEEEEENSPCQVSELHTLQTDIPSVRSKSTHSVFECNQGCFDTNSHTK